MIARRDWRIFSNRYIFLSNKQIYYLNGASGGTRTPNLTGRNRLRYPLRHRCFSSPPLGGLFNMKTYYRIIWKRQAKKKYFFLTIDRFGEFRFNLSIIFVQYFINSDISLVQSRRFGYV